MATGSSPIFPPPVLLPQPRRLTRLAGVACLADALRESLDPRLPAEGYRLRLADDGLELTAGSAAGAFYGRQTLTQLRRQYGAEAPALEIDDWPDFPARGVMLDISRCKVPTLATLYELVDLLAEWKINQLQLYTEHTFAYRHHSLVWQDASPMTGEDIQALDAYCRERFVELVPNQNSFGHFERWLKHEPYRHLAEAPDGAFYWGAQRPPAVLCPIDPGSIKLIRELHAELLPNFSSRLFNVGCDETMELGQGRSQELAAARGKERVYLDFLCQIHASVTANQRTMMFWGDIILHRPELIPELPRPIIALSWGYEADHPFDHEAAQFAAAGVPFYVCPGTSSWGTLVGRTDNALANLRAAAEAGLRHGAIGFLNTDWGDMGHLQYQPVSYLPFAAGAAYSWCLEGNRDLALAAAVDLHGFQPAPGSPAAGQLAADLGNLYQACGKLRANGSLLFWLLVAGNNDLPGQLEGVGLDGLHATQAKLADCQARLAKLRLQRADGELIVAELANNAAMLEQGLRRGLAALGEDVWQPEALQPLRDEHRRLWLARNRPGGLPESLGWLERGSR